MPKAPHPLPLLLLATLLGIAGGYWLKVPFPAIFAGLLITSSGLVATFIIRRARFRLVCALLCALGAVALLALLNISWQLYRPPPPNHIVHFSNGDKLSIIGRVVKSPEFFQNRTEIVVRAYYLRRDNKQIAITGDILASGQGKLDVAFNDLLKMDSKLSKPRNFQNFGGFDYERYLLFDEILVRGNINSPNDILVLRRGDKNGWKWQIEGFRERFSEAIAASCASPQREIIQAMILGTNKAIPPDIREEFNITGITHIIAISGFHISIVAALFYFLVINLLRLSPYLLLRFNGIKIALLATVPPIILFSLIAGGSPSVVRATIMVIVFVLALFLKRHLNINNVLALTALVILTFSPSALFNISFQLSFGALLAIVFISPRLAAILSPPIKHAELVGWRFYWAKLTRSAFLTLVATISATIGVAPLIALYFNRISLVGIPANIALIPLMGFISIPLCAGILFALPFSSALAGFFIGMADFVISLSIVINRFFAQLPYASIYLPTPSLGEIIAYYLLLVALILLLDKKIANQKVWAALVALCLFFFVSDFSLKAHMRSTDKNLRMDVFDVGSGNAVLLRIPHGKTLLIDGGGMFGARFDIGKLVVAPALWREGITKLDYMVLSHPHPDHLNGLLFIAKAFAVGEFWKGRDATDSESYQELIKTLQSRKIPLKVIGVRRYKRTIGRATLCVLPRDGNRENGSAASLRNDKMDFLNENALVIKITIGKVSILLPADISQAEEARLIEQYGGFLKSTILLVPHHGSRFSSSAGFVKATAPQIAIITCGANNIFGHPAPAVLEEYARHGVKVLRSDRDGQISIKTDGTSVDVRTFANSQWVKIIAPAADATKH